MWYLRLTRGERIPLTNEEQIKIKEELSEDSSDGMEMVQIKGQLIKRSHIAGLLWEDEVQNPNLANIQDWERKNSDRAEIIEEWKEERQGILDRTPEEKAELEFENRVKIAWFLRTWSYDIPLEKTKAIKDRLIKYFQKNPDEYPAGADSYRDLLPPSLSSRGPLGEPLRRSELTGKGRT